MTFSEPAASIDLASFRRVSSGEQAAHYIRELIFEGRLTSGSHIPQDDIAAELGMSRIPIREALITLERQGWVRIERHRGAYVQPLDPDAVLDHYELCGLIFGLAAQRAIERSADELAPRLQPLVRELPGLVDDPAAFGRVARAFHAHVIDAARSHRIAVTLRTLSSMVPGDFFTRVPGSVPLERKGLAAISRAVKRHDAEAAATAYRAMMRPIGQLVAELFEARGLFDNADRTGV